MRDSGAEVSEHKRAARVHQKSERGNTPIQQHQTQLSVRTHTFTHAIYSLLYINLSLTLTFVRIGINTLTHGAINYSRSHTTLLLGLHLV